MDLIPSGMRCDFTFNSQAATDACGESVYNYHVHVIMCERSGMIFTMCQETITTLAGLKGFMEHL